MTNLLNKIYRVRFVLIFMSTYVLILSIPARSLVSNKEALTAIALVTVVAVFTWILGIVASFAFKPKYEVLETVLVNSPVRGRWLALNSPTTKVPSHGTRAYGQAYAIDLVLEPEDQERPEFGGEFMRANDQYPAFGAPLYAMTTGIVVRASDWRRDHRARSNMASIFYLMIEGMLREIGGPTFIVGNHVTIRTEDGVFATVAHIKRGSMLVKVGDQVEAGQQIGLCGNSGNSSEPHVHAQLSDRKSLWLAAGIPMAFQSVELTNNQEPSTESRESSPLVDGLPENNTHMVAS